MSHSNRVQLHFNRLCKIIIRESFVPVQQLFSRTKARNNSRATFCIQCKTNKLDFIKIAREHPLIQRQQRRHRPTLRDSHHKYRVSMKPICVEIRNECCELSVQIDGDINIRVVLSIRKDFFVLENENIPSSVWVDFPKGRLKFSVWLPHCRSVSINNGVAFIR